jgi:hypothetical protein
MLAWLRSVRQGFSVVGALIAFQGCDGDNLGPVQTTDSDGGTAGSSPAHEEGGRGSSTAGGGQAATGGTSAGGTSNLGEAGDANAGDAGAGRADGGAAGGEGGATGDPLNPSSFDGIYAVDEMTRNESDCAVEGASVLSAEPNHFFVLQTLDHGTSLQHTWLALCASPEDCATIAARAREVDTVPSGDWTLAFNAGALDGWGFVAGAPSSDGCDDDVVLRALGTGTPRRALRVELRSYVVPSHPADAGECTFADAYLLFEDSTCFEYRVLTGTYLRAA